MKRNGEKFWDRFAFLYSSLHMRRNRELYREVEKNALRYLEGNMEVLELACGTGELSEALSEHAASWTATDFSPRMIEEAEKKSSGRVKYEVADGTDLPYGDSSFDAVFIANALHVVPEPSRILSEVRRCLKPHGLLIAPNFVYEGKVNKTRLWLMARAGFVTYRKWTVESYRDYLEGEGFIAEESVLIPGKLLPECFVALRLN